MLLMANIILLAHAAVPHHHHDKVAVASILLSLDGTSASEALRFSKGSLLVLGATVCWGLENNCTRRIADKDPMEIVTVKGFGSGLGALCIALSLGEAFPMWRHLVILLMLGFVANGLSIFFYTLAQRGIGAAKTSAYYALAPFIGAFLSVVILGKPIGWIFIVATIVMAAGCWLAGGEFSSCINLLFFNYLPFVNTQTFL